MSDKEDTSLVPRPSGELARISPGASAVIDGMVNDATDIIRARDAIRHRVGDYEFREADYQQILLWAKAVGMTPDELVERMQREGGDKFAVSDGAIIEFRWDFRRIGLDLSQVPHLEKLLCWSNRLTELDLSQVPHLKELDCGDNDLTELDLSQVPHLKELYCGWNRLTELDLSRVPHLEELDCGLNQLAELNLSWIPYLKTIGCRENRLTELDLSRVPHLKTLYCTDNDLTELDLSQVPHLKELYCGSNELTELDISGLKEREPEVSCDPDVRIHQRDDQDPVIF